MRGKPNNNYKQIIRTKSPTAFTSHVSIPTEYPQTTKKATNTKIESHHMGSLDAKPRFVSPENAYDKKKAS